MTAAALLVLALALVLPWTTAYQHGGLGGAQAITETPRLLFAVAGQVLVGLWIASRDRWLGVLVVYVALNALRAPLGALPLVVSGYVTFGALVIVAARGLPATWSFVWPFDRPCWDSAGRRAPDYVRTIDLHQRARDLFVLAALVQIAYAADQHFGYDVLWNAASAPYRLDRQLPGTIGHGNWLGVSLAMVGPLAPAAALPVFVGGLMLAQSRLGLVALAIGLLVKYGLRERAGDRASHTQGLSPSPRAKPTLESRELGKHRAIDADRRPKLRDRHRDLLVHGWKAITPAAAITLVALAWWMPKSMSNITARWTIAMLGFDIWRFTGGYLGVLVGLGPGTWWLYIPSAQETFGILRGVEFAPAHNEPMQWIFEQGLIGLVLVGGLLWSYRRAFQGPYAGALAALAVTTLGMFPFHLAQLAVPALVLVGLATTEVDAAKP